MAELTTASTITRGVKGDVVVSRYLSNGLADACWHGNAMPLSVQKCNSNSSVRYKGGAAISPSVRYIGSRLGAESDIGRRESEGRALYIANRGESESPAD
eukprot:CAMPEP_0113878296 /NCGR_PEP_ID=MMETSP0780_2-20120614/6596_1 /TAXON_ID=652834 /ORGANISM="Palpitomonas bilix" /LENGTH=99 /DNA_ID=CAMNT_0000864735 /DNA_START=569 /DNA_END=868 /DNA_ORIENTATION=- /assembly_acc=CAM_ASM_000599